MGQDQCPVGDDHDHQRPRDRHQRQQGGAQGGEGDVPGEVVTHRQRRAGLDGSSRRPTRYCPAVAASNFATARPGPSRIGVVAGGGPVGADRDQRAVGAGHCEPELLPGRGVGRVARELGRVLAVDDHGAGVGDSHGIRTGNRRTFEAVDLVQRADGAHRAPDKGCREAQDGQDAGDPVPAARRLRTDRGSVVGVGVGGSAVVGTLSARRSQDSPPFSSPLNLRFSPSLESGRPSGAVGPACHGHAPDRLRAGSHPRGLG